MRLTTLIIILCLANTSLQAGRIYVTVGGSGTKSGNNWSNARQGESTLKAIIANAVVGDSLFIAEGKYLPTSIIDVNAAISLKTGVSLFGGFPQPDGSLLNPTWNHRNPKTYFTILSGDIDDNDWDGDNTPYTQIADEIMGSNSNNVVIVPAGTSNVVIDGLIISGGDAKNGSGGGIYSDYGAVITLANCRIIGNKATQGGGFFNYTGGLNSQVLACVFAGNAANDGAAVYNQSNAKTAFRKCVFSENIAYSNGGAIYNNYSSPIVINNCVINNNTAAQGGGIYNNVSAINIINDVLVGNNATNGAAIYNTASSSTLIVNTKIAGNYANSLGGGVLNNGGCMPKIKNSIFSGNTPTDISNVGTATTMINNSIVTVYNNNNCTNCPGNFGHEDPQFINLNDPDGLDDVWMTVDDGLRIKPGSLGINAGLNSSIPTYITVDVKNALRVKESMVDLGAYEMLTFKSAGYVSTISAANQAVFANEESIDAAGWTHYYDTVSKKILLSIYKNGYDIGRINDGIFDVSIHTTPNYGTGNGTAIDAPYAEEGDFVSMNRWWNVNPNPQLPNGNSGVKIRTYFTDQDSVDVNGSIPGVQNDIAIKQFHFYKINDFSTSLNPDGNGNTNDAHTGVYMAEAYDMSGYWEYTYAETSSTDTWRLGKFNDVQYAEYEVAKFSGGGGGFSGANGQVFPVELLSFEVTERNGTNRAVWITTKEENTQQFNVERSTDGYVYELLGTVLAAGNSDEKKTYDFTDFTAPSGNNYYRLRMIDNDGQFSYSNIVTVGSVNNAFTVYPNPATERIFLEGEILRNGCVMITDIMGKLVAEEIMDNSANVNIEVSKWKKGLYIVKLYDENNIIAGTKKLVVQ